jgi:hypothetical protein
MTTNTALKITRIDLEALDATGQMVRVRQWADGWQEGDAPVRDNVDFDKSIIRRLMDYESQGFTVEMCDATHGRALRGKTERVDFTQEADGWHVRKYPHGWTAKTKPLSHKIMTQADADLALQWCRDNGWNVRTWPSGARAFKGEVRPVRDRSAILTMRSKVKAQLYAGATGTNKIFYDFAFDY